MGRSAIHRRPRTNPVVNVTVSSHHDNAIYHDNATYHDNAIYHDNGGATGMDPSNTRPLMGATEVRCARPWLGTNLHSADDGAEFLPWP